MVRIELAPEVLDDFDRFFDHLSELGVDEVSTRIDEILQAIQILESSPLIGRPVEGGKRELIIGRGSRGYVALYRFVPGIEVVFVLAIRAQRESGYKRRR
jgi:toxin ParE1/3/4